MNIKIILVLFLLFVSTACGSYNISVNVSGSIVNPVADYKHNSGSQNSYRVGLDDTEQQEEQKYFSPVDNVTENETLPEILEVEPTKKALKGQDLWWTPIIFTISGLLYFIWKHMNNEKEGE